MDVCSRHWKYIKTLWLLLLLCISFEKGSSRFRSNKRSIDSLIYHHYKGITKHYRNTRSLNSLKPREDDDEKQYLKVEVEMKNQTLLSGENAVFKCKVDEYPRTNMTYTWYKNNEKLNKSDLDPRIKIKYRNWGSKLTIEGVFTSDEGLYRCEASNSIQRVHTSAYLIVSFQKPNDSGHKIEMSHLKGRCELYKGAACERYLRGKYVHVQSFNPQDVAEPEIITGFEALAEIPEISNNCQNYLTKAFCFYVFPPCELNENLLPTNDPKPVRLCQADCDLLKYNVCRTEFYKQTSNDFIRSIVSEANCSNLPPITSPDTQCTSLGLPSLINIDHKCYNDSGESYRGIMNVTDSGNPCQIWTNTMRYEYPELSGGHNFCRNPGEEEDAPWCFVDYDNKTKEKCPVLLCDKPIDLDNKTETSYFKGTCEVYKGQTCASYFRGKYVYVESFNSQDSVESGIITGFKALADTPGISDNCQNYLTKAFCFYVFPPCELNANLLPTNDPKPVRLCQADCDLLKYNVCRTEFYKQTSNDFIRTIFSEINCSNLPPITSPNTNCTSLGLPSLINIDHKCYNDSGESYRGIMNITDSGNPCQIWTNTMRYEHPNLSGGHNFCRNPGEEEDAPWCYVDYDNKTKEKCSISSCEKPIDSKHRITTSHLKESCELYKGQACASYLRGKYVYVESFNPQDDAEFTINTTFKVLAETSEISNNCQNYLTKAFCFYILPPCELNENLLPTSDPKPVRLCQADCDLLKYNVCRTEYYKQTSNDFIRLIFNEAICSSLPAITSPNTNCTSLGLPSLINTDHKCYNDSGESYRGIMNVTDSGNPCQIWTNFMRYEHSELSGGHNFCRNPGGKEDAPWCYVDYDKKKKEKCPVSSCEYTNIGNSPDLTMILILAVSVPLFVGCLVLVLCVAFRKSKTNKTAHINGIPIKTKTLFTKKAKVPELSSDVIHVVGELGDGKFGKVFKAQILSNLHYCPNNPVAIKTLAEKATSTQVQSFQQEIKTFCNLQHLNVACMKAVVVQPSLRCMVFEYTNGADLHEYLVLHSPQADFAKPPSSTSSHASTTIDQSDFIRMAMQVSAGMEYLTSHNFIHRDLAARNVLVCGNMELKICNLGVVRDSYLSSYYRSPQGGQMLPIRWMAPESLQSWQFSGKSSVWSFGVLLWEMFSYGLQPYCGYSNHEVLDMISRRQLLICPDQCPVKVYSLMIECWVGNPKLRPQFKDLHARLVGWEGTNTARMTSHPGQEVHQKNLPFASNQRMHPEGAVLACSRNNEENGNSSQYFNDSSNQCLKPNEHFGMSQQQMCSSYSSGHSRNSGSVALSDCNHHPQPCTNNLSSEQENPLLPLQSRASYSEKSVPINHCREQEAIHQQSPNVYVNLENQNSRSFDQPNLKRSRPNSESCLASEETILLSVHQDHKHNDNSISPNQSKPLLAPKSSNDTSNGDKSLQTRPHGSEATNGTERVGKNFSPDVGSGKTTSCDSGLPCKNTENEVNDVHRPLLGQEPSQSSHPPNICSSDLSSMETQNGIDVRESV